MALKGLKLSNMQIWNSWILELYFIICFQISFDVYDHTRFTKIEATWNLGHCSHMLALSVVAICIQIEIDWNGIATNTDVLGALFANMD